MLVEIRVNKRDILKKIELKGFNKSLWNRAGKAMFKYSMIEEGDKIAVGISGGKDSLTLLNLLVRVKLISEVNFEIIPIHVHYKKYDGSFDEVKKYVESLGLSLVIKETNIEEIVFVEKQMKNPCFLCSRMRRGVLYKFMVENKINKLALGHHLDDLIETFLMNFFFQGNSNVMKPIYKSEEYGVKIIRPLATVEEKTVIRYSNKAKLPIYISECQFKEADSKRAYVKKMVSDFSENGQNVRQVALKSLESILLNDNNS